jgi:ArsR family transcriptional regulator, virulence genes transcriptional regulator
MNMKPRDMEAAAGQASELLKALANPTRLMIVCQLIERARPVGELAGLLKLRQSTVSQQLALLRNVGLVETRRDGQTIWYSIASAPARDVLTTLYHIYCGAKPVCEPTAAGGRASPRRPSARRRS